MSWLIDLDLHIALLSLDDRLSLRVAEEFLMPSIGVTVKHQIRIQTIQSFLSEWSALSTSLNPNLIGAIPVVKRIDKILEGIRPR